MKKTKKPTTGGSSEGVAIDAQLKTHLVNTGVDESKAGSILAAMGLEEKKQMLQQYIKVDTKAQASGAEPVDNQLDRAMMTKEPNELHNIIKGLRVSLTNAPISWMKGFEKASGLDKILFVLQDRVTRPKKERDLVANNILHEIVRCISHYMNYKDGMTAVRSSPKCLKLLARLLYEKDKKIIHSVLITLAVVCVSDENGRLLVLDSLGDLIKTKQANHRFERLIKLLLKTKPDCLEYKEMLMSFINAIVNTRHTEHDLDTRINLRNEFVSLGLANVFKTMKAVSKDENLLGQIEVYESIAADDYKLKTELLKEIQQDYTKIDDVYTMIKGNIYNMSFEEMALLQCFQSLLLLLIPSDIEQEQAQAQAQAQAQEQAQASSSTVSVTSSRKRKGDNRKRLYCKIVNEMVMHITHPPNCLDPDFQNYRVKKELDNEEQSVDKSVVEYIEKNIKEVHSSIEEHRKDLGDMQLSMSKDNDNVENEKKKMETELTKLRQEILSNGQEIQSKKALNELEIKEQEGALENLKQDKELFTKANTGDKAALKKAAETIEEIRKAVPVAAGAPPPPPGAGAPPPPPAPGAPPPPPPPPGMGAPPPPPPPPGMGGPPPPPPPPPGMGGPPPPPPPPGMGGPPPPPPPPGGGPPGPPPPPGMGGPPPPPGGFARPTGPAAKKKWETSQQMKRVAWQKIVPMKVKGTFWEKADEAKHVDGLDMKMFEELFSAAKKKPTEAADAGPKKPEKKAEQTCLDGKKQYNLSILLGRIKLTFPEIKAVFLKMDGSIFDESVLLNFQKYAPDNDEIAALKDPPFPREELSKADIFTHMMYTTIFHFEKRVEIMLFFNQFSEKATDVQKDLDSVLLAAVELKTSKKFAQVLEMLLFGNYMNCSTRNGKPSFGFKIDFLEKLANTKGTVNTKITLLHYITKCIKEKEPDLLELRSELSHVADAVRVSVQQLQGERAQLEKGIKNIENEIPKHEKNETKDPDDKFTEFATNFLKEAQEKMKKIKETEERMNKAYNDLIKFFGDDPARNTKSSEEIFGVYANFLTLYDKSIKENEEFVKAQEKAEKKKKDQEEKKKRDEDRKAAREAKRQQAAAAANKGGPDGALMDNLIGQLRSGAAFQSAAAANGGSTRKRERKTREPS